MRTWIMIFFLSSFTVSLVRADDSISSDFKSAEINAEIKKLPELESTLRSLMEARLKVARGELIDKLKEYQVKATQAGDLDEALKVRNTIADLEKQQESKNTLPASDAPKVVKQNIPKNAARFGKSRYFLVTEPKTWAEAKKLCEEQGGHLARIESAEEHAFCAQLIQSLRNNGEHSWALVDGTDIETKGTYVFSNGEPVKYVKWDVKKPTGRADCRYLGLYAVTGLYYDCGEKAQPFICEWD